MDLIVNGIYNSEGFSISLVSRSFFFIYQEVEIPGLELVFVGIVYHCSFIFWCCPAALHIYKVSFP